MQQTAMTKFISFDTDRQCKWEHDEWITGYVSDEDNPKHCCLIAETGETFCPKHKMLTELMEGE